MTLDEAKNYADQLTMLCAKYNDAHRSGQLNEKHFYSDKFEYIAGLIKTAGFNFEDRKYIFPIPLSEITSNPKIAEQQNSGWN